MTDNLKPHWPRIRAAILREAGLVTGHRYRHEVNYAATDLGTALLAGA